MKELLDYYLGFLDGMSESEYHMTRCNTKEYLVELLYGEDETETTNH